MQLCPAPRRLTVIKDLPVQCVRKLIAWGDGPVRELVRPCPAQHVLPARQLFANVFKLLLVQIRGDRIDGCRKRHTVNAGHLQRPLLLRAQTLNLGFDHRP